MIRKALLLGAMGISLAAIATACVTTTTGGGGGTGTGGTSTGGTAGTSTGGTAGTSTGGTAGTSTGGTAGTSTGGSGGVGTDAGSYTLPTGCLADPTQWQLDCNPVTNDGCNTAAGEACDFTQGGWTCYPSGNTGKLGDACNSNGPYCEGTLTCDIPMSDAGADAGADAGGDAGQAGICKHYCCSDSDCNGGTCTPFNAQVGTIGVCN